MTDVALGHNEIISRIGDHRVDSPRRFRLADCDPDSIGGLTDDLKEEAKMAFKTERKRIRKQQQRLYAEQGQALLVVFQATDTGGKDGTIRSVFKGVNAQGVRVSSFKQPSREERDHHFLWRYDLHTPRKGMISIFNRSHYEEVLVVRVKNLAPQPKWSLRYEDINEFEQLLADNRIRVIKFFLNISRDEQKARLQRRLDNPNKHWKFSSADLVERKFWDDYQEAYQEAIRKCSADHAPWYVVPANNKWYRDLVVARGVAEALEEMNPQFPPVEEGLDDIVIPH